MPEHMTQSKNRSLEIPKFLPYVSKPKRRATIEAGLAKFEQQKHKQAILSTLCEVHKSGLTPDPFHAENSWRYLFGLAEYYFWMVTGFWTEVDLIPPAVRRKRLHKVASVLEGARVLVQETLEEEAGDDLFYAWWGGPSDPDAEGVCLGPSHFEPTFRKEVAVLDKILKTLTAAARRAANDVRTTQGRPKGTGVLPNEFVEALAAVYRHTTAVKPGAGDGDFAKICLCNSRCVRPVQRCRGRERGWYAQI
jgi:hypothetical protein